MFINVDSQIEQKYGWFGMGRRQRRRAMEEKELFFLKIEEQSAYGLARRTEGDGGSMGYRLFRRPPTFCFVRLGFGILLCVFVYLFSAGLSR